MKRLKDVLHQAEQLKKDQTLTVQLPLQGSWPVCAHVLDKKVLLAIAAALGAKRPLLVRGEPGSGKSHLARAAAQLLQRHFISTVVQPFTEYQELLWTFDHTQRLADAQLMSCGTGVPVLADDEHKAAENKTPASSTAALLAPARYTSPGPLWYALDWQDACRQVNQTGYHPEATTDAKPPEALVLLIDEIDKADISLANGLLEVLGNGRFRVPHRPEPVGGGISPLVVITSNSIRELPSALLRRCVILDIFLPEGDALVAHLQTIGKAHFADMDAEVIKEAAMRIREDRESQAGQTLKTGQAEYIDLLRALRETSASTKEQLHWLKELASFFLKRQASAD